jgi:23S rRNA-/tRNA-specific pseudouridylate synthase
MKEWETITITTGLVQGGENRSERMKVVPWKDSFSGPNYNDIKKAVTNMTVLKHRRLGSLVCFEPVTGRKHQIRVHITTKNNSFILGDYKYGIGCTKKFAVYKCNVASSV